MGLIGTKERSDSMAELRNCPFCGGEASIVIYQGSKRIFYIECKGCNALMGNPRIMISGMKGKLYFENEAELVEAWNTRKPEEAVVAELENLKGEYEHHCIHGAWQRGAIDGAIIALNKAITIVRGKE